MFKPLLFSLFSIFIISCSVSDDELKEGWWKYGSGQHIGDFLDFENLTVLNDTIFKRQKRLGIIIDREESLFGLSSRKIFIQPLIDSVDPIEENFKIIKTNFPDSPEEYINPYPKELGVYHQK